MESAHSVLCLVSKQRVVGIRAEMCAREREWERGRKATISGPKGARARERERERERGYHGVQLQVYKKHPFRCRFTLINFAIFVHDLLLNLSQLTHIDIPSLALVSNSCEKKINENRKGKRKFFISYYFGKLEGRISG